MALPQPKNPLTQIALAFMSPDKSVFHNTLKKGIKETVGLFLRNAGDKLTDDAQSETEPSNEEKNHD
jgi:hypothetical protein